MIGRRIEKLFVDGLDWLYRRMKGQGDLPPYSLRRFVGGATGFVQVGRWFLSEFRRLRLLHEGCRILDVGCGCGRLAAVFAKDPELVELGVSYTGMDYRGTVNRLKYTFLVHPGADPQQIRLAYRGMEAA